MNLQEWRNKVDQIDLKLATLIAERNEIVTEIGRLKQREGVPVVDPSREHQVIENVFSIAGGNRSESTARIFKSIIQEARRIQLDELKSPGGNSR